MADPFVKFETGPVEKRYWQEYDKSHPFGGVVVQIGD